MSSVRKYDGPCVPPFTQVVEVGDDTSLWGMMGYRPISVVLSRFCEDFLPLCVGEGRHVWPMVKYVFSTKVWWTMCDALHTSSRSRRGYLALGYDGVLSYFSCFKSILWRFSSLVCRWRASRMVHGMKVIRMYYELNRVIHKREFWVTRQRQLHVIMQMHSGSQLHLISLDMMDE